jgi:hypothetical protein
MYKIMEIVDVIINVYGKPWQTICTLKSLIKHSGNHIDKIYLIEENQQPYDANINQVLTYFNNIVHYKPEKYQFLPNKQSVGDLSIPENRYVFRYQYGIENSDKKYVFITHNDILYTNDIIGDMLNEIDDSIGIGSIGQCWNCPCNSAGVCDGEKFNTYNPNVKDIDFYIKKYPPGRGNQFINNINWDNLKPLPECRLNEFACLINREIAQKESVTSTGEVYFFGSYDGIDLACNWFRELYLKGYTFKNYNIGLSSVHGYYSNNTAGYPTQLDVIKYNESERFAKEYYNKNLKE